MYISYRGKVILSISDKPPLTNNPEISILEISQNISQEDISQYEIHNDKLIKKNTPPKF